MGSEMNTEIFYTRLGRLLLDGCCGARSTLDHNGCFGVNAVHLRFPMDPAPANRIERAFFKLKVSTGHPEKVGPVLRQSLDCLGKSLVGGSSIGPYHGIVDNAVYRAQCAQCSVWRFENHPLVFCSKRPHEEHAYHEPDWGGDSIALAGSKNWERIAVFVKRLQNAVAGLDVIMHFM